MPPLRSATRTKPINAMVLAVGLMARAADLLVWLARGKTKRDIGEILGASPRTIIRHMENILTKPDVETRTATARQVHQQTGRQLLSQRRLGRAPFIMG